MKVAVRVIVFILFAQVVVSSAQLVSLLIGQAYSCKAVMVYSRTQMAVVTTANMAIIPNTETVTCYSR